MEGMQELGSALRAERERQGRSLEQVYQATRITVHYLEHIERGEFEELPGEVYLKGFLRRYAQFLGLDGEALVRQYAERRRPTSMEATEAAALRPSRIGSARRSRARDQGGSPQGAAAQPVKIGLIIAAVILAAVATGWALAIWSVRPPAPPEKATLPGSLPQPVALPSPEADAAPAPVTAPAPETEPATAPVAVPGTAATAPVQGGAKTVSAPIRVSVRLTERCWFRVVGDGRLLFEGELSAGAETAWAAQEKLTVKVGNPRGAIMTWNDRPVELAEVEPTTRLFTPENVSVVPASAAPVSQAPAQAAPAPGTP